jgi:hypothetical protein
MYSWRENTLTHLGAAIADMCQMQFFGKKYANWR